MAWKAVREEQLDSDLAEVANAIRERGGTSAPLSFPGGMADAVRAIPTGEAKTAADVTVNGSTVTIPAGLYSSQVQKSVAQGTAGNPVAGKTYGNRYVKITPSVENTTGYITGGTKTGVPIIVYPSDVVSGTLDIMSNGEVDVSDYQKVNVAVSSSEKGDPGSIRASSELSSAAGRQTLRVEWGVPNMSQLLGVSIYHERAISSAYSDIVAIHHMFNSLGETEIADLVIYSTGGSSYTYAAEKNANVNIIADTSRNIVTVTTNNSGLGFVKYASKSLYAYLVPIYKS